MIIYGILKNLVKKCVENEKFKKKLKLIDTL